MSAPLLGPGQRLQEFEKAAVHFLVPLAREAVNTEEAGRLPRATDLLIEGGPDAIKHMDSFEAGYLTDGEDRLILDEQNH